MHWKFKALIQKYISILPQPLSHPLNYTLQRNFGNLKKVNPINHFKAGVKIIQMLEGQNQTVEDAVFLEVGTGHRLNLPIALWLCGVKRIITVDINKYLRPELVLEDLTYMRNHQTEVDDTFGKYSQTTIYQARMKELVKLTNFEKFKSTLDITYLSPADATDLGLDDGSIDYHISFTVLEHISPDVLNKIIGEAKRVLKSDGLFIHCIDFSDHFAHADSNISSINFLQYDQQEWDRLAGNQYAYHNRLRVDDFINILDNSNFRMVVVEPAVDEHALALLDQGFIIDRQFRGKKMETLAVKDVWIVATPGKH